LLHRCNGTKNLSPKNISNAEFTTGLPKPPFLAVLPPFSKCLKLVAKGGKAYKSSVWANVVISALLMFFGAKDFRAVAAMKLLRTTRFFKHLAPSQT
jgi:hypothetical protein